MKQIIINWLLSLSWDHRQRKMLVVDLYFKLGNGIQGGGGEAQRVTNGYDTDIRGTGASWR